jgi:hypothetical protein
MLKNSIKPYVNKYITYLDLLPYDILNLIYRHKFKLDFNDVLKSLKIQLQPSYQPFNMYNKLIMSIINYYKIHYYDIQFIPETVLFFIYDITQNMGKIDCSRINNSYNNVNWKHNSLNLVNLYYNTCDENLENLELFLYTLNYQELLSFKKFIN